MEMCCDCCCIMLLSSQSKQGEAFRCPLSPEIALLVSLSNSYSFDCEDSECDPNQHCLYNQLQSVSLHIFKSVFLKGDTLGGIPRLNTDLSF